MSKTSVSLTEQQHKVGQSEMNHYKKEGEKERQRDRETEAETERSLNMVFISNCSRGESLAAGTGHLEMWSGERSQVSFLPEGKTLAVRPRSPVWSQVLEIQGNAGLGFI